MNTISNFQVFSPIPFRQYSPQVTQLSVLEVNKNLGHFDYEENFYVSFYGKDYVAGMTGKRNCVLLPPPTSHVILVRKKSQHLIPLIRSDNDLPKVIGSGIGETVLGLFAKYSDTIHCMRATEKDLRVKYHEEVGRKRTNLFLGTKVQLAKLLLSAQDKTGIEL